MISSYDNSRRWHILIAGVIINTCVGFCYSWSIFQSAWIQLFGWDLKSVSLGFTIMMSLSSFLQIFAGKAMERFSVRSIIIAGGLLLGAGGIALGMADSLGKLYIAAVFFGLGMALIYPCTVANTGKFFPDKPGLVSGLLAAGMGSGAVIWSPLASVMISHFSVSGSLKLLGVLFLILVCIPALLIVDAKNHLQIETGGASQRDKAWKEMLRDREFYLIAALLTIGGSSGMIVMSQSSMIVQKSLGLTLTQAAIIVGILAAFNTVGRVFWGGLSDKFGRPVIISILFLSLIGAMILLAVIDSSGLFIAALLGVGCAYGGLMGMISSLTSDSFGLKNLGVNFAIMFVTVGISSIVGPMMASAMVDATGSYTGAFILAGILCAVGFVLSLVFVKSK